MARRLPTGTITLLCTDIEGSTGIVGRLGGGYVDVLEVHRQLVRDAVIAAGGMEIDCRGDEMLLVFVEAGDAVRGAVEAQRALASHAWPEGNEVRVRMGLHTGEPSVGDEGYIGLDVVRAARICSAGHGGQILLSETTRALLGNDLPERVSVRDLGQAHLKDIQHEHVYQLSIDDGGASFPPLKTEPTEKTESWGESLSRRIQEQVQRDIEQSLLGQGPPPKTKKSFRFFKRRD